LLQEQEEMALLREQPTLYLKMLQAQELDGGIQIGTW
jgi:hypothetical protein